MIQELIEQLIKIEKKYQTEVLEWVNNTIYSISVNFTANESDNFKKILDISDLQIFYLKDQIEKLLCFGSIEKIELQGKNRFENFRKRIHEIKSRVVDIDNIDTSKSNIRVTGGITFTEVPSKDIWENFNPVDFFLPIIQILELGEIIYLRVNIKDIDQLKNIIELLKTEQNDASKPKTNKVLSIDYPISKEEWYNTINSAQQLMDSSSLEKVVLSRVSEIRTESKLNTSTIIRKLENHYPECYNFVLKATSGEVFYGASPELFCEVEGKKITSVALAGTRPRGFDEIQDGSLANELLNTTKEREEHQLVVENIQAVLQDVGAKIYSPKDPTIFKLSNVQHLKTDITGELKEMYNIIDILQRLHPTPALGGKPRDLALEFIETHEIKDRGMYASPLGWVDLDMNGKFIVAIRSAITIDDKTWLYAGAGIMRESDANQEWDEIELKFKPILEALEVRL